MPRKNPAREANQLAEQAVALAEYAARALNAAQQLRLKSKPVDPFPLTTAERATLAVLSPVPAKLRKKLAATDTTFTVAETVSLVTVVAESLLGADPRQQVALLMVTRKLMDALQDRIVASNLPAKAAKQVPTDTVYQVKVTLLGSDPPIWRRLLIQDCTLDKLHEHLQTAMGWENSHLHHFRIGEEYYGHPELLESTYDELGYQDSTAATISGLMPQGKRRFRLLYEYDFGDSWMHEVLIEKRLQAEAGRKYPQCLKGECACPPEDCGGIWGYPDFVQAIQDPEHDQHEELLEWVGGAFDPEAFDAEAATKRMRRGLPDWRSL